MAQAQAHPTQCFTFTSILLVEVNPPVHLSELNAMGYINTASMYNAAWILLVDAQERVGL